MATGVAGVAIAVASRPYPGEEANGDAHAVQRHGDVWRIALIDGLGHGPDAAAAARAACDALALHPELPVADALAVCHRALHGTRGAAITVVSLDLAAGAAVFAGVGNVDVRLRQRGRDERYLPQRGIVGGAIPTVRPLALPLRDPDWLLVLHTDGVSDRFALARDGESPDAALQPLADALLEEWGRATDDATVLIAYPIPEE